MRRPVRSLLALLVAVAALALAACGGGGGGAGAGPPASSAFVPADVPVFVTLATDFDSEQWKTAEALARRFPGATGALAQLDELRGAVGPEVGIAVLELPAASAQGADDSSAADRSPPILLVTKPDDPAKLEASLAKSQDRPVWRVVDGWYVVASDQATLDAAVAAATASPLEKSEPFANVMDELPGEAVARVYVGGAAIAQTLGQRGGQNPLSGLLGGLGSAGTSTALGLSLLAQPEGARVDGVVAGGELPAAESFTPSLGSLVPPDALAYVAFHDARTPLESFLDAVSAQNPDFDQQLGQLQLALGISLTNDLLPLFEGEHALFVRAGAPIPEVTLILSPADPQRALATLDKLTSGLPALAQGAGSEAPFTVTSTTIAGLPVKQIDIVGQDVSLYYALVGDHLVLTTAAKGIADVAAPASSSIESDPLYQQAAEAADLPGESAGLVYVNVRDGLSQLESLAGQSGTDVPASPSALNPFLKPLQYLLLYGEGGEPLRFTGFVGIS